MRRFVPINDRILVRRRDASRVSKGGIIIPDAAREKPQEGVVIAKGPGKLDLHGVRHPIGVQVGDVVVFGKHAGAAMDGLDDGDLIVTELDILGCVEEVEGPPAS